MVPGVASDMDGRLRAHMHQVVALHPVPARYKVRGILIEPVLQIEKLVLPVHILWYDIPALGVRYDIKQLWLHNISLFSLFNI